MEMQSVIGIAYNSMFAGTCAPSEHRAVYSLDSGHRMLVHISRSRHLASNTLESMHLGRVVSCVSWSTTLV